MSQTRLTSFFASRKRPASDDIVSSKSKVAHVESVSSTKGGGKRISYTCTPSNNEAKCDKPTTTLNLNKSEKVEDKPAVSPQVDDVNQQDFNVFKKKLSAVNVIKEPKQSINIDVASSARKELSLSDIRKKLRNNPKFAKIKERAEQLSKHIEEFKERTAKKNLKEFDTIDVEVPSSPLKKRVQSDLLSPKKHVEAPNEDVGKRPFMSPRKVAVSPVKSPRKVSAYEKNVKPLTIASSLSLPFTYRILGEIFRAVETAVALMHNRNEMITFAKLKPCVQEMLKRDFTEKELSQIKHLVPDFYNFEIGKSKSFPTSMNKNSYELVVMPNFPNENGVMSPAVLLERRRHFFDTILKVVKKHHAQFLLTLDPPMVIPDNKLTRWHPLFEIENVPEIECAKLPNKPNVEACTSAQDVLSKARQLFKCNTKMERAMEKLAQAKAEGSAEKDATPSTSKPLLNPALRNLPPALLEMVKAKQAAKALEAMTRSSEDDKLYAIYSHLPELARSLRNIFVTERKNVLALNVVVSKLENSFKWVSSNQFREDIKVLSEQVPELVQLHNLRQATYLKLDKTAKMDAILAKLEVLAKKYKS